MGTAGIDSYITKIKHIKRHDDHMAIKKQSFIKKSKKRIEKSNIEISIFKKYWYLSIYRNTLISSQFTELDPYTVISLSQPRKPGSLLPLCSQTACVEGKRK